MARLLRRRSRPVIFRSWDCNQPSSAHDHRPIELLRPSQRFFTINVIFHRQHNNTFSSKLNCWSRSHHAYPTPGRPKNPRDERKTWRIFGKTFYLKNKKTLNNFSPFQGIGQVIIYTAKLGPLGFFKGYVPAFVRLGPQTILTFVFLEQLRINFGTRKTAEK